MNHPYFPHSIDAHLDDKLLTLRAALGLEGYGLYWLIVEIMAHSDDRCIYASETMYSNLSIRTGVSIRKLKSFINYGIEAKLFYLAENKTEMTKIIESFGQTIPKLSPNYEQTMSKLSPNFPKLFTKYLLSWAAFMDGKAKKYSENSGKRWHRQEQDNAMAKQSESNGNPTGMPLLTNGLPMAKQSESNEMKLNEIKLNEIKLISANQPIDEEKIPEEEQKPKPKAKRQKLVTLPIVYPDWLPVEEFEKYVDNRKKIRHPMTDYAIEGTIEKLDNFRKQGHDIKAILKQAYTRGYRDVFPVDAASTSNGSSARMSTFEKEAFILQENGSVIWTVKDGGAYKQVGTKDGKPVYQKLKGGNNEQNVA